MKIITFNANGIRAAARKGFFDWLARQQADIVCIQETKAQLEQLENQLYHPAGYHCYYASAVKKGYSGTALYTRIAPDNIDFEPSWPLAFEEGRWILADYDLWSGEKLSVVSLYMPSGSSGEERLTIKFRFMDELFAVLKRLRRRCKRLIVCADWNICHQPIDLKNWRANQKNSGFLPEERAWLQRLYDELQFKDSFRIVDPRADRYTWWSNRGRARENNVGWRLDYQLITPELADKVKSAAIYCEQQFSDHAPLTMEYDI